MIRGNAGKVVIVALAVMLAASLLPITPVTAADDETSMEAQVEVLEKDGTSYGDRLAGSWNVWLPFWSLGKPDGWGAMVLFNGWINIRLKEEVVDADTIVIRAAKRGWWPCAMKVWISADGWRWKLVGNSRVFSNEYQDYEFTVSSGNVKFIKVERNGGPWSWLSLDAVGAKGGDNGNNKNGK